MIVTDHGRVQESLPEIALVRHRDEMTRIAISEVVNVIALMMHSPDETETVIVSPMPKTTHGETEERRMTGDAKDFALTERVARVKTRRKITRVATESTLGVKLTTRMVEDRREVGGIGGKATPREKRKTGEIATRKSLPGWKHTFRQIRILQGFWVRLRMAKWMAFRLGRRT